MKIYTLDSEELERYVNKFMKFFITHLLDCNYLNPKIAEEYLLDYCIIIKKPSFFNHFWRKYLSKEDEKYGKEVRRFIIVKQMSLPKIESIADSAEDLEKKEKKKQFEVIDLKPKKEDE